MRSLLPFTCLTHLSAYLSVLMVLDLPLLLFSDGKCIFRALRVLKSSFWVLALADCSLLQGAHETDTRVSKWQGLISRFTLWSVMRRRGSYSMGYANCACTLGSGQRERCTNLQPLVDGLSCSELTRLKALELLGGDVLWEFELEPETTGHVI